MLAQLRSILRENILWFGCSATLSTEAEQYILQNAGFRPVGNNPWQTEVIRTSINRDDLFICVRPIPRGKLSVFESLYFLPVTGLAQEFQELPESYYRVEDQIVLTLVSEWPRSLQEFPGVVDHN